METFVLVVENHSFQRAANKKKISSVAVAKQINQLEKGLKIQLLKRTTRSLTLTEAGKIYYESSKKILREMEEVDAMMANIVKEPQGPLRVTITPHFARTYVLPFLPQFLEKYPKILLNIELAERLPNLKEEGIDVLLGMSLSPSQDLIARKLGETRYVLCATPTYLKNHGEPKKPQDMTSHRYINHSMRREPFTLAFDKGQSVPVSTCLLINDTQTMFECALQGLGIVKLHYYVVKEALEKGKLKEILYSYREKDQPIYAFYQETKFVSSKIRFFIDFVVDCMEIN